MSRQGADAGPPTQNGGPLARAAVGSTVGGAILGVGIAALTVDLDPHLVGDAPALVAWGALFYALLCLVPGLGAGLLLAAMARLRPGWSPVARFLATAVGVAPVIYLLLLPATGLAGRFLSDALFAGSLPRRLLYLAGIGLVCLLAALPLHLALGRHSGRRLVAGLVLLATAALALAAILHPPPEAGSRSVAVELPRMAETPPPVILLCVDGADPVVMEELMAVGELPAFARLAREGTWGLLDTLEPTLSPVIWTTLATGRTPEAHGIRHFVHFRLPGVDAPIYEFPLHTGLNFELLPRVEDLFDVTLRLPYTTGMRRVEALWNMVDRADAAAGAAVDSGTETRADVGVYRWLMAWPAEEVEGFFVAGAIAWAEIQSREGRHYPPDLYRGLERGKLPPPSREDLFELLGVAPSSDAVPGRRLLQGALRDPTVRNLTALLRRHRPVFTAASFHPVDASQHLFGRFRGGDDPRAPVVDAHYRLTDRRLGELLDALEAFAPETRLVVVSDHGFDFRANHHANAPPGVLFARGDGFAAGQRVAGLSIYDVAPLVLRLLHLPVADDMPGTRSGRYRRALDEAWRGDHPEHRIATWESGTREASDEVMRNEEVEEVLRSLGYVGD